MKLESKEINLVLSGTGALYPVHAGAVCALLDLGYSFKAVAGTSGGAIIGSAVASQTPRDRIKRAFIDYNPFNILFKKILWPFNQGWGLYSNHALVPILNRIGGTNTFKDSPIPIHIVGTQILPTYKRVVFNEESFPNLSLSEACQISSSVPLLFRAIKRNGKTMIDGTFADNLHIEPFKNDFKNTIAINVKVRAVSHPKTFWQYLKTCLSMLLTGQGTGVHVPEELNLIEVDVYDYVTPLKFSLSRSDRNRLFEVGYHTVVKHLQVN